MNYYKIEWEHHGTEDPYQYVIETDDQGNEIKKIEFYKNGTTCFASEQVEQGTFLTPEKFDIADYNFKDDEQTLKGYKITSEEFFEAWEKIAKNPKHIII